MLFIASKTWWAKKNHQQWFFLIFEPIVSKESPICSTENRGYVALSKHLWRNWAKASSNYQPTKMICCFQCEKVRERDSTEKELEKTSLSNRTFLALPISYIADFE